MIKNDKVRYGLAALISLSLIVGVFLLLRREPKGIAGNAPLIETSSTIVTTDPQLTTSLFASANGTMGDTEVEIDGDTLFNQVALNGNRDRRLRTLNEVNEALIPGSRMSIGAEAYIDKYTRSLTVPVFYKIDNIKTSDPKGLRKVEIDSDQGRNKYEAVDVYVTFDSTRIIYDRVRDVSWDGTYTESHNKETFNDMKVTLVKSGDLWFVYDIENSEELVNARFATWSGTSKELISSSNEKAVGSIKVDGFEPYDGGN